MPALRTKDTPVRSLEVTTAALPTLAIISPTPRAFTFPLNHNLEDSPYSTPSSSPFQHDLASPFYTTTATPPPRTLSPTCSILSTPSSSSSSAVATSPITGSSSSSLTHKRRKSSQSVDPIERRPKKGDEDYIKRPENAFILFRRKCCEERSNPDDAPSLPASSAPTTNPPANPSAQPKKQRQADLSKTISQQWKSLSVQERQYWEQLAKEKKKEHEMMYPNYVYRPQRSKSKAASSASGAASATKASAKKASSSDGPGAKGADEKDEERISFVVPLVPSQQQHLNTSPTPGGFYNSRPHGRSISAPTPPPPPFLFTQQISIPNLYNNNNTGGYTSNTTPNSPYLNNQSTFGFGGGVGRSMSLSQGMRGMGMPAFPHAQPALPTSSLSGVPMISGRRSSHPGYTNNNHHLERDQDFGFDSSEFLRGIYDMASTTTPITTTTTSTPAPVHHHHHRQLSPLTLTTALSSSSSSSSNNPNGISPASSGPSSPLSAPYTPNSAYNNSNHSNNNAYVDTGVNSSNAMYMMDVNSSFPTHHDNNDNANANANLLVHAFSQSSLEDGAFPISSGVGVGGYDMGVDMGMGMYGGDMNVGIGVGEFEQELHEWGVGLNSMHLHHQQQQFPIHPPHHVDLGSIYPSTTSPSAGYAPGSLVVSEEQYTKSHIGGGAFSVGVEMPLLFGGRGRGGVGGGGDGDGDGGDEEVGLLAAYEWENSPTSFHNLSPSSFNTHITNHHHHHINGNSSGNNAFMPDDFDISAIPPIEIGLPKFGGGIGEGEGGEEEEGSGGMSMGMEVDGTTTGTRTGTGMVEDASLVV